MKFKSAYLLISCLILFCLNKNTCQGADKKEDHVSVFELPLEKLLNVTIMSATKKEEDLFSTPASAYVITAEEIRRSGATSVPALLRLVPGVEVAQIDSSTYAVTIRGLNNEHASKLLVMIDGRSVYGPLFAGVYWDVHDVMLEDVERIEVIRGPGGALWGSNAVNGVINIITKEAQDTQGFLVAAGSGSHEKAFASLRYGGRVGEKTHYRIYTKFFNRDSTPSRGVGDEADDWDAFQAGFRIDVQPSSVDSVSVHGNLMSGKLGSGVGSFSAESKLRTLEPSVERFVARAYNLLTKWKHDFSPTSVMTLRAYYDRVEHLEEIIEEIRDTIDIDFQHSCRIKNHHLMWGLGYRFSTDHTDGSYLFSLDPSSRDLQLYSGFIQDEIILVQDRLRLIAGIKLEHNKYTDMEYQPNLRVVWSPAESHIFWAAISRAVRIPSRTDISSTTNLAMWPFTRRIFGDDDFRAETLIAYEAGYRFRAGNRLFVDISFFYNNYDNFRSSESKSPRLSLKPVPQLLVSSTVDNKLEGVTYGFELSADWKVTRQWKLFAGYSYIDIHMHTPASSTSLKSFESQREGRSPENQLFLRSYLELPYNLELDIILKYVDNLPHAGIHSYTRFDMRLGWHITKACEVSIIGQNLIDSRHVEFVDRAGIEAHEIERRFFIKLLWQF